jgi:hypothetical protein
MRIFFVYSNDLRRMRGDESIPSLEVLEAWFSAISDGSRLSSQPFIPWRVAVAATRPPPPPFSTITATAI